MAFSISVLVAFSIFVVTHDTALASESPPIPSPCCDLLAQLVASQVRVAELEAEVLLARGGDDEQQRPTVLILANAFAEPVDIFWTDTAVLPLVRELYGSAEPLTVLAPVYAYPGHRFEALLRSAGHVPGAFADAVSLPRARNDGRPPGTPLGHVFGSVGAGGGGAHLSAKLLERRGRGRGGAEPAASACVDRGSDEAGESERSAPTAEAARAVCEGWRGEGHCGAGSRFSPFMRAACRATCAFCGDSAAAADAAVAAVDAAEAQVRGSPPPPEEETDDQARAEGRGGGTAACGASGECAAGSAAGAAAATAAAAGRPPKPPKPPAPVILPDGRTLPARCRRPSGAKPAAFGEPGAINALFEGLVANATLAEELGGIEVSRRATNLINPQRHFHSTPPLFDPLSRAPSLLFLFFPCSLSRFFSSSSSPSSCAPFSASAPPPGAEPRPVAAELRCFSLVGRGGGARDLLRLGERRGLGQERGRRRSPARRILRVGRRTPARTHTSPRHGRVLRVFRHARIPRCPLRTAHRVKEPPQRTRTVSGDAVKRTTPPPPHPRMRGARRSFAHPLIFFFLSSLFFLKVVSDERTSSSCWCGAECLARPVLRGVMERAAAVTGTPLENAEYLQMLRCAPRSHRHGERCRSLQQSGWLLRKKKRGGGAAFCK